MLRSLVAERQSPYNREHRVFGRDSELALKGTMKPLTVLALVAVVVFVSACVSESRTSVRHLLLIHCDSEEAMLEVTSESVRLTPIGSSSNGLAAEELRRADVVLGLVNDETVFVEIEGAEYRGVVPWELTFAALDGEKFGPMSAYLTATGERAVIVAGRFAWWVARQ